MSSERLPRLPETQAGGIHRPDTVRAPKATGRPVKAFENATPWADLGQLLGLLDDLSHGATAFWISFGASLG